MVRHDGPVMGAQQPAFEQRGDLMSVRQKAGFVEGTVSLGPD
jgi:hypothetical protein